MASPGFEPETFSHEKTIHFEFYLDSDTAISISGEMADKIDLSNEDVSVTVELIDSLIMKLVPSWKPTSESSSCRANSSCGDQHLCQNGGTLFECPWGSGLVKPTSMTSDSSAEYGITTASDATNFKVLESDKYSFDECYKGSDGYGSSSDYMVHVLKRIMKLIFGDSVMMNDSAMNSAISSPHISKTFSLSSFCSLSELSLTDNNLYDGLKVEVDSIEKQFHQRFVELLRMKEEAIRSAKKKWIAKKIIAAN
ncbi:hypothetical protein M0R45_023615 [Rubus argutus]|uniref:Uncharacterized protein n=1 Tax=Rubus argutus TaxID=59490 RepID=A0AAW1WQ38_RUBAR